MVSKNTRIGVRAVVVYVQNDVEQNLWFVVQKE
jgi:hypothetical protein